MATIEVRVTPRSPRREVVVRGDAVLIRVTASPSEGRATEEARRALAAAAGVAPARVSLRSGPRSRRKVFEVEGLTEAELRRRLRP